MRPSEEPHCVSLLLVLRSESPAGLEVYLHALHLLTTVDEGLQAYGKSSSSPSRSPSGLTLSSAPDECCSPCSGPAGPRRRRLGLCVCGGGGGRGAGRRGCSAAAGAEERPAADPGAAAGAAALQPELEPQTQDQ